MFSAQSPSPAEEYTTFTSDITATPHIRVRTGDQQTASPRRVIGGAVAFGNFAPSIPPQHDAAATPKAASSTRPARTPKSYHLFSSPAQQMDVLAGVHVPGFDEPEPSYPPSPSMTPIATITAPTPGTLKRGLQGLGSSPARAVKRARQATMAGTSMPASPAYRRALRGNSTLSFTETLAPPNNHRLMTHRPLERAVSGPAVFAPPATQSRVMSTNSVASSVSTDIASPMMSYMPMPASQPDLGSMNWNMSYVPQVNSAPGSGTIAPSALLGHGLNSNLDSTGFVASPEMLQQEFIRALSASLSPVPEHAQIMSTISQDGYLSQGLNTIQENDTGNYDNYTYIPGQALPHSGTFANVTYPSVPGTSYNPPTTGWSQNMNFNFDFSQPAPNFGRSTSYNFGSSQSMPQSFPVQRAVSLPFVPTLPGVAQNPPDMTQGLFGGATHAFGSSEEAEEIDALLRSMNQDQAIEQTVPVTPSKKRMVHPPIGNRMKPGPKPKPKTPKSARKGSAIKSGASPLPDSAGPSPLLAHADLPARSLSQMTEMIYNGPAHPLQPSTTSGPGPATMAFMAAGNNTTTTSRPVHGVHQPLPPNMPDDPQLTLDPPTRGTTSENGVSGLPKEFIEKLYRVETEDPHGKNKFYRCLIEGCQRSFPRKSAICSHIQTHLDDKPFICRCGCAFVRMHDLRRHSRIHSGAKPFECDCGKSFARGDALMRHRQRDICPGGLNPGAPRKIKGKPKGKSNSPPAQNAPQYASLPQPQPYAGGYMYIPQ